MICESDGGIIGFFLSEERRILGVTDLGVDGLEGALCI